MNAGLLIDGLAFAESPRWHDGALWCSDFYTHQVLRVALDGTAQVVAEVPQQPSGLGWLPDGRLLVVSMLDRRLLRLDPGGLVTVVDLSGMVAHPCNDMVVDAAGRAYIGNFGFDMLDRRASVQPTVLVMVTPDGQARVVADDLLFPNGAVLTPDGRTLVIGETYGQRLTAFRIADDGTLHDRRAWAALSRPAPGLYPDGICRDSAGAIWVASPPTKAFVRVLEGGTITDRIDVAGGNQAIACALGGTDGRRLFMVTGKVRAGAPSLAARIGRIDWVDVAVPA